MTDPPLGRLFACAMLSGLFWQAISRGAVYYVDHSHPRASDTNRGTDEAKPWNSLDQAMKTVKPGDTVYVKGSSNAESADAVYRTTGSAGFAVRTPGLKGRPISFLAAKGHTVIVEGRMNGVGIDLTNASHHIFRGFVIRRFGKATEGSGATGVLIERCEFTQTKETGLRLREVSDFTMRDCHVHHCAESGISVRSGTNVTFERVESSYNSDGRGSDGDGDGFHTYGGENFRFIDCVARGNSEDGFDLNANATLLNCVSSGHTACNIKLWRRKEDNFAPKSMLLVNCLVYGAKEAGIKVSEGATLILYNSVVYGNGEEGVAFRRPNHNRGPHKIESRLVNNIIAHNGGRAIGVAQQTPPQIRVHADHNLYYRNGQPNVGLAENSHAVEDKAPLFFAPRAGDFNLRPGSPALDAGVPLKEVAFDQQRRKRPFGGIPDIGAMERVTIVGNEAPTLHKPKLSALDVNEGETLRLNFNAEDPEGHRPVFLLDDSALNEMNIDRQSGEFIFRPTFDQGGNNNQASHVHKVKVLVTDEHYAFPANAVELTITVHNVNRPPVYGGLPSYTMIEGRPFLLTLDVNDPDEGDVVSQTLQGLPAGASFAPSKSEIYWLPTKEQIGVHKTELAVGDGISNRVFPVSFEVLPTAAYVAPMEPEDIFYVDIQSGSDTNDGQSKTSAWKTIQRAANTLKAGQMVLIREGVYFEQITPKSTGRPHEMIVFKAHPGEQPVLDGTGNDSSPEGFQATSHMVLDGLTFRNYSESIDLRGSGLKDIVIVNCTIKDAKDYGIYGWNGDRLRVENVVMERLGDRGYYGGGTNVHFHGVKISHVNGRGISISGSHFDNINILNSEISATDCGILANARNMLVMNCTIRDNKGVGVWALGKNVRVANCIISGTTLHRGSAANISIGRGASIEILNSVLARSERFGLYIHDDAKHCRLVNSIIYDNKDLEIRGIRLPSLKENHNLFYDPREELAPRGQASRVVDPQFIRVGEDDFHLQKSSPAIDGGVTLKLIKTDIDGNARPQGKRFDIGAHEHMPAIKGLNE